jgi:phosphatidylglycerophosphate synthase
VDAAFKRFRHWRLPMVAKQLADFITFLRSSLMLLFPWFAIVYGRESLPWAGALLALNWTGDILDGSLARRSRFERQTWIGGHDLEIDMAVSIGLLVFLLINRYVQVSVVVLYVGLWSLYFLVKGIPLSMGMLFQAPIYAWFIYTALMFAPKIGWVLVGWVISAVIITWPRFPQEVIPNFLSGIQSTFLQE